MVISIISTILTAFFGWSGGRGDDYWKAHPRWPRWILQSWTRDWIIGPVLAAAAYLLGVHSFWIIASILTTGAALSTYWDELFGYDCFWFHGLVIGLAAFPIAFVTGHWWMFGIRALILAAWMGIWSYLIDDAGLEEAGRYAILGATIQMIC